MTHSVGRRCRHAVVNRDVVARGYRWGGGGGGDDDDDDATTSLSRRHCRGSGEAAAVLRENLA